MYSLLCLVKEVIVRTVLTALMTYGTGTPRAISISPRIEAILIGALQRTLRPLTGYPKRDSNNKEDGEKAHFFSASLFTSAKRSSASHIFSVTLAQSRTKKGQRFLKLMPCSS